MVTTIKARYQNGVLKPLEPLDLPENQVVEIHIEPTEQATGEVVKLGGAWTEYFPDGDTLSFEEIQRITHDAQLQSLERTLRQIEGDFGDDDPSQ